MVLYGAFCICECGCRNDRGWSLRWVVRSLTTFWARTSGEYPDSFALSHSWAFLLPLREMCMHFKSRRLCGGFDQVVVFVCPCSLLVVRPRSRLVQTSPTHNGGAGFICFLTLVRWHSSPAWTGPIVGSPVRRREVTTARAVAAESLPAITEHGRACAGRLMQGRCDLSCAYAGSVKDQPSVKVLLALEVFLRRRYRRAQRGKGV